MKKIYYEKRGRRYKPVAEYNNELFDAYPEGTHLVQCYPGGQSTCYNIKPNHAAMIAASRVAEDVMSRALYEASEMRPRRTPITEEQKKAWEHLVKVFGDEARCLQYPSARDIAEAGVKALQVEADKLMQHASVKRAYEQFQLVCELTKKENA